MTVSLVKIVLCAIQKYCKNKDDNCNNCPFNIKDSWHEYCLFMGNIPHEGTTPDDWELDKVDFKDDIEEIN